MNDPRPLDTSKLGPIRVQPTSSLVSIRARDILANAVRARGAGYRNAADSIQSGAYGNIWIEAALSGIETALRKGMDGE